MNMAPAVFDRLVVEVLDGLPPELERRLANVEIVVAAWPEAAHRGGSGGRAGLLGLYEGIPLTERSAGYGMVLPDKVTLYRGPLLARCRGVEELRSEVRRTVLHELAHHFGIDDDRLTDLGAY